MHYILTRLYHYIVIPWLLYYTIIEWLLHYFIPCFWHYIVIAWLLQYIFSAWFCYEIGALQSFTCIILELLHDCCVTLLLYDCFITLPLHDFAMTLLLDFCSELLLNDSSIEKDHMEDWKGLLFELLNDCCITLIPWLLDYIVALHFYCMILHYIIT